MVNTPSTYLYVKLNWDANRFLPAESKECSKFNKGEGRNCVSFHLPVCLIFRRAYFLSSYKLVQKQNKSRDID